MPVRVEQNHLSSRHLNTIHSDKGKEHLRDLLPVFKLLHLPVTSMTTYEALPQAREQTSSFWLRQAMLMELGLPPAFKMPASGAKALS